MTPLLLLPPSRYFPSHVKTLRMSQSDFSLPSVPPRDYSVKRKYDFTYSGSDQDVGFKSVVLAVAAARRRLLLSLLSVVHSDADAEGWTSAVANDNTVRDTVPSCVSPSRECALQLESCSWVFNRYFIVQWLLLVATTSAITQRNSCK